MPRRLRAVIEGGIYRAYKLSAREAEVLREGDETERFLDLFGRVTADEALQTPKQRLEARLVREQVTGE